MRSPTDTLIAAMEEVGTARECIIVMINEAGEIIWSCSSDALTVKLGLLETAKHCIVAGIVRDR